MVSTNKIILLFSTLVVVIQVGIAQLPESGNFAEYNKSNTNESSTQDVVPFETLVAASRLSCAKSCIQEIQCASFMYSKTTRKCRLYNETARENVKFVSKKDDDGVVYNWDYCQNGGIKSGNACLCVNSYVGEKCERLMTDCSDGFYSGFYDNQEGIFTIKPDSAIDSFQVRCIMKCGGKLVIQEHTTDGLNFNRNWTEYKDGFGDPEGDSWLGNENIYQLTSSRSFDLIIVLEFAANMSYINTQPGLNRTLVYRGFKLSTEESGYRLDFDDNRVPDVLDCLRLYRGNQFSTYDAGNDTGCAVNNSCGWWFGTACSECNLNAPLNATTNQPGLAMWNTTDTFMLPVLGTMMMIRASDVDVGEDTSCTTLVALQNFTGGLKIEFYSHHPSVYV